MKKTLLAILMIALAFAVSSCKRTNVADPPVDGPAGFSILLEGTANPNVLLVDGSEHTSVIRVRASDIKNNPLVGKAILFVQINDSAQIEWGVFENMASTIQKVTGSDGVATATFYGPTILLGTQMYILARMAIDGSNFSRDYYIPLSLSRFNSQNSAPVVTITAPLADATISGTLPIIAQVADESGLATVDCYIDGINISSQPATTSNTYTFSMDCSKYSNGNHNIEVVAFDKQGLRGAETVIVNVNNQNSPLTISITAPAPDATVSGSAVSISALAFADSGISKVDCYIDNSIIATLPASSSNIYEFIWDSSLYANGIHANKVTAFDTNGLSASDTINVVVNNQDTGPVVAVTAPAEDAVVSGTVAITALATADYGIDKVDCYIDNQIIDSMAGSTTSDTYSFSWNATTQYGNGRHTIKVTAYDKKGKDASDSVSVTLNNADLVPVAEIIYPSNGENIILPAGTAISVKANATDDKGINRVSFYVNGILKQLNMSKSNTLYQYNWTPPASGPYTLYVIAYDTINQATMSAEVSVTVNINKGAIPVVKITSPGNSATVSGTVDITALATADYGIDYVECFNGTQLIDRKPGSTTSDTYSFSWDTTLFPNGSYTITVTAFDKKVPSQTGVATITVTVNNI